MAGKGKLTDFSILEALRDRLYEAFVNNEPPPKVGDLLKVMEMKRKLTVEGRAERKFWEMVNKIREKELSKKVNTSRRKETKSG